MKLRLTRLPQVDKDFEELPTRGHVLQALRLISRLQRKPFAGQPLGYRPRTGNLGGCRKLYFSIGPTVRPDYRIVYRILPDENDPEEVRVVAVGKRTSESVYHEAVKRLKGM